MKKLLSLLALVPLSMSTVLATSACASTENSTVKSLDKVINETDLGQIAINGSGLPTSKEIIKFVQQKNIDKTINWNDIKVDEVTITATSATFKTTNTAVYAGQVQVTYKIVLSLDIVIKTKDLGQIKLIDRELPTEQEILSKLKELNTDKSIHWDAIKVNSTSINNDTATLISNNHDIYIGTVTLHYQIDTSLTLDSVIKRTDLGQIVTHNSIIPTDTQIMDAVKKFNKDPNIKWDKIYVDKLILPDRVDIFSNDQNIYTGSVMVKFKVKNIVDLDNVIKEPNIGTIWTNNGKNELTEQQIKDAVNKVNKDVNWDAIKITDITDTTATLISSDESIYRGKVDLTYTIHYILDLNDVIKTKDLGEIGITGDLPSVEDIISFAQTSNRIKQIDWSKITVDESTITANSATLISLDKNFYKWEAKVTYIIKQI